MEIGGIMSQIILDISSNTHKNSEAYYKRMIDELAAVDAHKHEVVLKWQLFESSEHNTKASLYLFEEMARWAYLTHNYKTTASVFDLKSLKFLLGCNLPYDLPFIKIANNRKYDWLIAETPRKYPRYKSVGNASHYFMDMETPLWCVSEYPADIKDYPVGVKNISDHTVGLELYRRNEPVIWEKHYKLPDSTGLDAGPFASTPDELKEVL
jgi:hypothetical protein